MAKRKFSSQKYRALFGFYLRLAYALSETVKFCLPFITNFLYSDLFQHIPPPTVRNLRIISSYCFGFQLNYRFDQLEKLDESNFLLQQHDLHCPLVPFRRLFHSNVHSEIVYMLSLLIGRGFQIIIRDGLQLLFMRYVFFYWSVDLHSYAISLHHNRGIQSTVLDCIEVLNSSLNFCCKNLIILQQFDR